MSFVLMFSVLAPPQQVVGGCDINDGTLLASCVSLNPKHTSQHCLYHIYRDLLVKSTVVDNGETDCRRLKNECVPFLYRIVRQITLRKETAKRKEREVPLQEPTASAAGGAAAGSHGGRKAGTKSKTATLNQSTMR